ncbi:MAG: hypothetical protein LBH97_06735 [Treponema sp.]|nr:hypothetical protein [Treponema sp.]
MKRIVFLFVTVTAILFLAGCASSSPSGGASTENPSITIVNNTGYVVWYLFISPVTDDTWGKDLLDSDQVIHNGQSVTMKLPLPLSVNNRYDIRLIDSDEDSYSKYNVTVSANDQIIFTFNDFDEEDE